MKKLGLNSGYIGSDQRFSTNGIVGYDKLLLERKNGRFLPSISGILFLLDFFPATAVYSLRKLRGDYTGAAITVRRASNNDELNIGFNGESLDISTLNSFCSGTNGFATTWYDQQGSNNAIQVTAASQPKIYDSSTGVVLENGKPALSFDGGNDFLLVPHSNELNLAQSNSAIISVIKSDGGFRILQKGDGQGIATGDYFITEEGAGFNGGFKTDLTYSDDGIQHLLSIIYNYNSNFLQIVDGNILFDHPNTESYTSNTDNLYLGKRNNLGGTEGYFLGNIQEIILYNSNQSANRTAIETNINNYYNIF